MCNHFTCMYLGSVDTIDFGILACFAVKHRHKFAHAHNVTIQIPKNLNHFYLKLSALQLFAAV